MNNLEAIAHLLERGFGFDQWGIVGAYKTDSWNLYKDGKYYSNNPTEDGSLPEGVEHRPFLVNWGERGETSQEEAFVAPQDAAAFFIKKCGELKLLEGQE